MFQKLGVMEVVLIIVAVLLIFGPSKLPQLGKSIGESLREFKKSVKTVGDEMTAEADKKDEKETEKKA